MEPHFHNLVCQSWHAFLQAEGTSGLGWIGDKIVLPVGAFVLAFLVIWGTQGREAVKTRWARTFGLAFVASLSVFIIWHLSIFGWITVRTIYLDHQDSTGRWQAVVNEKNALKGLLKQKDEYIKQLKQDVDSKPRIVEKNKFIPEPQQCWMDTIGREPSPSIKEARTAVTVATHCNYRMEAPYEMSIKFDRDFLSGGVGLTHGSITVTDTEKRPGNVFYAEVEGPSVPANQLMIVTIQSASSQPPYAIGGTVKSK
jgi:hypothetical protein